MIHLGDITKIDGMAIPIVDVITGGSPCQDLSAAGKRAGLAGERSGLFMEQLRIVREMRERDEIDYGHTAALIRPRFMVWENVPGASSSNNGKDFQAVLTEIVRIVEADAPDVPMPDKGKWTKSGCLYDEMGRWSIAWRLHDAQYWGVPQRRRRISLVADFGGLAAPEVQFERKGVSGYSETSGEKRKRASENPSGGIDASGRTVATKEPILLESNQNHATVQTDGVSTALPASMGEGGGYIPMVVRADGCGRFDVGAVAVHALQDPITAEEVSPCISSGSQHGQAAIGVLQKTYQKTTGTLSPGAHPGSYNGQDAYNAMLVAIASCCADAEITTNGVSPTLLNRAGTGGNNVPSFCSDKKVVRRLTPLECERLQGYPDRWTDIGDWVDSKGKKHKGDADSPRYKALGNSIALPFWHWMLQRISSLYEETPTLGSLFDGIGGFPLCWESINGKGTAVWASEIEEFPIAVTKLRFPEGGDAE